MFGVICPVIFGEDSHYRCREAAVISVEKLPSTLHLHCTNYSDEP